jgi:hypothetical protein
MLGNRIVGSKQTGILGGLRSQISGNTILNPAQYIGIQLNDTSDSCTISGNILGNAANNYAEIYIASDYNTVQGNSCYSSAGKSHWGIQLIATANNNLVAGNVCSVHDVAGISELAGANDNLIYGNNCSGETVSQYALAGTNNVIKSVFPAMGGVMTYFSNNSNYNYTASSLTNLVFVQATNSVSITNDIVMFSDGLRIGRTNCVVNGTNALQIMNFGTNYYILLP